MPVIFIVHYVVRPRAPVLSLVERLKASGTLAYPPEFAAPQIFAMRTVGDHDYQGQQRNGETFLKLVILARAHQESKTIESYLNMRDGHDAFWAELLTESPLTVETFDMYWELEPVGKWINPDEIQTIHIDSLRAVQGPSTKTVPSRYVGEEPPSVGEWWDEAIANRLRDPSMFKTALLWILEQLGTQFAERRFRFLIDPNTISKDEIQEATAAKGWLLDSKAPLSISFDSQDFRDGLSFSYGLRAEAKPQRLLYSGAATIDLDWSESGWVITDARLIRHEQVIHYRGPRE